MKKLFIIASMLIIASCTPPTTTTPNDDDLQCKVDLGKQILEAESITKLAYIKGYEKQLDTMNLYLSTKSCDSCHQYWEYIRTITIE